MLTVPRRGFLKSATIVAVAATAGRSGGSISTQPPQQHDIKLSTNLISYHNICITETLVAIHRGTATSAHLHRAAQVTRLFANHMVQTGYAAFQNRVASTITREYIASFDIPSMQQQLQAHQIAYLQRYDKSINASEVPITLATSEDVARYVSERVKSGFRNHLLSGADRLEAQARRMALSESHSSQTSYKWDKTMGSYRTASDLSLQRRKLKRVASVCSMLPSGFCTTPPTAADVLEEILNIAGKICDGAAVIGVLTGAAMPIAVSICAVVAAADLGAATGKWLHNRLVAHCCGGNTTALET